MASPPPTPDIEQRLAELAADVDLPPTPQIAPAVRTRVEGTGRPRRQPWRPARRAAVAGLAAIVAAAGTAYAASPGFRDAVRDLLGVGGVRIERVQELPPTSEGRGLGIGPEVGLAKARRRADISPLLPSLPAIGPPDRVHVREVGGVGVVSSVWESTAGLPEAPETGAALLLSQFQARIDAPLLRKQVEATRVEPVAIGDRGFWLRGAEHTVAYRTGSGRFEARPRLAGNTLVWQRGGMTLRLEGELTRARALRIARSLR